jgi:hypothetical protein
MLRQPQFHLQSTGVDPPLRQSAWLHFADPLGRGVARLDLGPKRPGNRKNQRSTAEHNGQRKRGYQNRGGAIRYQREPGTSLLHKLLQI